MKTKLSPTLIGWFVLGALALVVAGLLSFQSRHIFSKPALFVAYFNDSVQGLDVGAAVKLRGVRVGRVQAIRVHYNAKARQSQVAVVGELDRQAVIDPEGQAIKLTDRATLQRLIEDGLRARIDLVGITGLQFVELDFLDPLQFPAPLQAGKAEYPVVPTVPSGMSELIANLSKVVADLHKVDFAALSHELKSLLTNANQQISGLDLKKMVAKVTAAAESVEALAGSSDSKGAFASLTKTASDVQGLVARLDTEVEPVGTELVHTLQAFHDAADSVHTFLGQQNGLGEEAARTLDRVREAAESLKQLADFLERNPSALITGKKAPGKER